MGHLVSKPRSAHWPISTDLSKTRKKSETSDAKHDAAEPRKYSSGSPGSVASSRSYATASADTFRSPDSYASEPPAYNSSSRAAPQMIERPKLAKIPVVKQIDFTTKKLQAQKNQEEQQRVSDLAHIDKNLAYLCKDLNEGEILMQDFPSRWLCNRLNEISHLCMLCSRQNFYLNKDVREKLIDQCAVVFKLAIRDCREIFNGTFNFGDLGNYREADRLIVKKKLTNLAASIYQTLPNERQRLYNTFIDLVDSEANAAVQRGDPTRLVELENGVQNFSSKMLGWDISDIRKSVEHLKLLDCNYASA